MGILPENFLRVFAENVNRLQAEMTPEREREFEAAYEIRLLETMWELTNGPV